MWNAPIEDLLAHVETVGTTAALNLLFDAGVRSNSNLRRRTCVYVTERIMQATWKSARLL